MKDYPGIRIPVGPTRKRLKGRKQRAAAKVVQSVRAAVVARDGGGCRLCHRRGTDAHHLTKRSQGGKWTTDNIVLLCRECHALIHRTGIRLTGSADGVLRIAGVTLSMWRDL